MNVIAAKHTIRVGLNLEVLHPGLGERCIRDLVDGVAIYLPFIHLIKRKVKHILMGVCAPFNFLNWSFIVYILHNFCWPLFPPRHLHVPFDSPMTKRYVSQLVQDLLEFFVSKNEATIWDKMEYASEFSSA